MAFAGTVTKSARIGSSTIQNTQTYSGEQLAEFEETIAAATVDKEFLVGIDPANIKACAIQATVPMVLKTNDAAAPQETFNLAADTPVLFEEGEAAIFAGALTKLIVSSTEAGIFRFACLSDS